MVLLGVPCPLLLAGVVCPVPLPVDSCDPVSLPAASSNLPVSVIVPTPSRAVSGCSGLASLGGSLVCVESLLGRLDGARVGSLDRLDGAGVDSLDRLDSIDGFLGVL